ncbi:uncharacterized protein LOC130986494 [Salvia miltiorrhiza]|uniref:uncharacterized protein LOC130986494 n=1 Tax=Salvia miltiorrhiza TaxID=226208 RepID=UPI0025AB73E3|nr:uncharacterized protein LOC130986494 [Salvia miltiorrhiza]
MERQHPPPLPHASTTAHGRALENLKSLVIKCAMASAPAQSLSVQHNTLIEKRIQELIPTIHTPDHPTYQWMIENAIKQLNEERGWDEETISKFILKEHKDLPWAHATFLKHHLERLSKNGSITKSHDGCYFIGRESITSDRVSKPRLTITCTTPSPSSSPSASPSPSPSSSSSDTSDSSWSIELKRGRKKKRNCRKKRPTTHPRGRGRAYARGRGRGRGRSACNEDMMKDACIGQAAAGDICMDVEILSLLTEDEASDQSVERKEVPQAQANQDNIHQQQSMVAPNDEHRMQEVQQNMGDSCSTLTTNPSSHGRELTSEQEGSKKVRQQRRSNIQSSQTRRGRGRPRKRVLQTRETANNVNLLGANMMEGNEDSMDELIDQVYCELTKPIVIDSDTDEENHQVEMNQEAECQAVEVWPQQQQQNVTGEAWRNTQISELGNDKLRPQMPKITPPTKDMLMEVAVEIMRPIEAAEIGDLLLQTQTQTGEPSLSRQGQSERYDIYHVKTHGHDECQITDEQKLQETKFAKDQGICIQEQNQRRKQRPRASRNESTNVADGSKSFNAGSALRRRK